ncbi:hypothetical protein BHM03_00059432 [Ensete ventricosum]|nr:hypothetical protein BHM03_00059432 [Ensete ventricosum]
MHPLRFPNNGIRAKQTQQGGGAASHNQPPCRAGHPRPGRLQGVAVCGQGPLQRGRPATARASLQVAAPAHGQTAGAAARSHAVGAVANGLQTAARGQPARGAIRTQCHGASELSLRYGKDTSVGVTQEWVDEGELPRERTKNRRWRRPYDMLAEATRGEVRRVFRVCVSKLASDESLGHQHMGAMYHRGRKLLGGHNGVKVGGRKGRGSDDESSGAQLPNSKASVRKEVDLEEHHSAAEADLPITKEEIQMQGNG